MTDTRLGAALGISREEAKRIREKVKLPAHSRAAGSIPTGRKPRQSRARRSGVRK